MECREYNYVKTRDNKRTLLLSYFTTILEEGNAVDFRFPLSEYLFSLSLSIILILSFPPPLFRFGLERIETPCVYPNLITLPLLFCQSFASFAISRARPTNYHHRRIGLPRDDAVLNGQYR